MTDRKNADEANERRQEEKRARFVNHMLEADAKRNAALYGVVDDYHWTVLGLENVGEELAHATSQQWNGRWGSRQEDEHMRCAEGRGDEHIELTGVVVLCSTLPVLPFVLPTARGFEGHTLRVPSLDGFDFGDVQWADSRLQGLSLRETTWGHLESIQIRNCDLARSKWESARVSGGLFDRCSFDGASLAGWALRESSFVQCRFSGAQGLDEVVFGGPCAFDREAMSSLLEQPGGVGLLARAGFPKQALEDARPFLVGDPANYYSALISYSHKDSAVALALYLLLSGAGVQCWIDAHQLLPGDDLFDAIDRGVRLWDKMILLCSKASLRSWWVEREIEKALQKEDALQKQQGREVRVLVPMDLDGAVWEWENGKASVVKARNVGDLRGWEGDPSDERVDQLVRALRSDRSGRGSAPIPKL